MKEATENEMKSVHEGVVWKRLEEDIRETMKQQPDVMVAHVPEAKVRDRKAVLNKDTQKSTVRQVMERIDALAVRHMSQTGMRPSSVFLGEEHLKILNQVPGLQAITLKSKFRFQEMNAYFVTNSPDLIAVA